MAQMLQINRFLDEIVGALPHGRDGLANGSVGGHDDHRQSSIGIECGAQHVHASAIGEFQICEHGGKTPAAQFIGRRGSIGGRRDLVTHATQRLQQHFAQLGFVFHQQNGFHAAHNKMPPKVFSLRAWTEEFSIQSMNIIYCGYPALRAWSSRSPSFCLASASACCLDCVSDWFWRTSSAYFLESRNWVPASA